MMHGRGISGSAEPKLTQRGWSTEASAGRGKCSSAAQSSVRSQAAEASIQSGPLVLARRKAGGDADPSPALAKQLLGVRASEKVGLVGGCP